MVKPTTTAGVTVRLADPVTDPTLAVIVDVPTALATTAPEPFTLAMAEAELQVAVGVKF
jgi:hypothetical protein